MEKKHRVSLGTDISKTVYNSKIGNDNSTLYSIQESPDISQSIRVPFWSSPSIQHRRNYSASFNISIKYFKKYFQKEEWQENIVHSIRIESTCRETLTNL